MDSKNLPVARAEYIERLNSNAVSIPDDPYKDLMRTVEEFDLILVSKGEDDGCRIYRTPDNHIVNLWLEAPSTSIEEGGMGFDDQIEWFTETEESGT
jgi:hypothetical protein